MTSLYDAHAQWASRPDDERFVNLYDLRAHVHAQRETSKSLVLSSRKLEARPMADHKGLALFGPSGGSATPSHWSFGQLAQRAGAPASYLRTLPADMAADCLNYGLRSREVEDLGILLRRPAGEQVVTLAAVTGPGYGRVWNAELVDALVQRFGDGTTGQWRVPGEFGKRVEVTKENTTLYASDRDLWVFLADEEHRIELPNRRDGKAGSLARGFFVWNSEVGSKTFGVKTFLFDYVCCNRIVWGAEGVQEVRIRHTVSAPERFVEQLQPALAAYAQGSTRGVLDAVNAARAKKLTGGLANEDAVEEFLARRFTRSQARVMMATHEQEEGRPVETLWDAVTAATAYAKTIPYQDERVEVEERAGRLLQP